MDKDLKTLLTVWRWTRWLLGAAALGTSWWAIANAYAKGLHPYEIIMVGWWVVGVSAGALLLIFILGERAIGWFERFREGRRVAKLLEDSVAVGHDRLTVGALVNVWLEDQSANEYIRTIRKNTILRVLKGAVRQGLINKLGEEADVTVNTFCDQKSAADFFCNRKWLDVRLEDEGAMYNPNH